jgi:TetR/AcrR family transcriptional regulator
LTVLAQGRAHLYDVTVADPIPRSKAPTPEGTAAHRPRRAPRPEERQRDAERTRQQLLAAALDEFSAKGFSGARVQDIAARAGVNKQLINYYFGSKEGLYEALQEMWRQQEAAFTSPDLPIDVLIGRYLHASLADPRMTRLLVWDGLAETTGESLSYPQSGDDQETGTNDVADLRRRQANGELASDLDPACVLLALMGALSAPLIMPQVARRIGLDPNSGEFEARYTQQLQRIVRHLTDRAAGTPHTPA